MAGLYTNGTADREGKLFCELMNDEERAIVEAVPYLLESYHYVQDQKRTDRMKRDGARIFLDSGAFSAFTLDKKIDLTAYCRYIVANDDIVEVCSVLDGIGEALLTYQNQAAMEALQVRPLPCFHYGEDERYLAYYVENYPYITLGGTALADGTGQLRVWLDRCWSKYICDAEGKAKVKVHGFALTSIPLMQRYPWHSVDSSTWVTKAFRGEIIIPEIGIIVLGQESPQRKDAGKHFDTMNGLWQNRIKAAVERRGFTIERLKSVYVSRWVFNLQIFNELNESYKNKSLTFQADQIALF